MGGEGPWPFYPPLADCKLESRTLKRVDRGTPWRCLDRDPEIQFFRKELNFNSKNQTGISPIFHLVKKMANSVTVILPFLSLSAAVGGFFISLHSLTSKTPSWFLSYSLILLAAYVK